MAVEYVGRKALSSGSRSLVSTRSVCGKRDPRRVHEQRHAALVHAATAGAARHLAVLVRRQQSATGAVELEHLAHDDRPRGHVDAQRQRVGREHGAQLACLEELLDQQLDLRQQPAWCTATPRGRKRPSSSATWRRLRSAGGRSASRDLASRTSSAACGTGCSATQLEAASSVARRLNRK